MPKGFFLNYRYLTSHKPAEASVVNFGGTHKPDNCPIPLGASGVAMIFEIDDLEIDLVDTDDRRFFTSSVAAVTSAIASRSGPS